MVDKKKVQIFVRDRNKGFSKHDSEHLRSVSFRDVKSFFEQRIGDVEEGLHKRIKELKENIKRIEAFGGDVEKAVSYHNEKIDSVVVDLEERTDKNLADIRKKLKEILEENSKSVFLVNEKVENFTKEFSDSARILREEKEGIESFVVEKTNRIIDSFNELAKDNEGVLEKLKGELSDFNKKIIDDFVSGAKHEISRQVLSLNGFLGKISVENREIQNSLSERIEERFVSVKKHFEEDFKSYMKSFDSELKKKEAEFVGKIIAVEDDKNRMFGEMEDFKKEISKLTHDYVVKLDSELKRIRDEKVDFKDHEREYMKKITERFAAKEKVLEERADKLRDGLGAVIEEERGKFVRSENTFRDVFQEKVLNLREHLESRISNAEKLLFDRALKIVGERINSSFGNLKSFEQKLSSKIDEVDKRVIFFGEKESEFYSQMAREEQLRGQKIADEVEEFEKGLNKRFLEMEGDFSSLKGVIIDEVEELIKDIKGVSEDRDKVFDKNLKNLADFSGKIAKKVDVLANSVGERARELDNMHSVVDHQLTEMREEINSMEAKMDLRDRGFSMHDYVDHMTRYEEQLVGLVKSLKRKGMDESRIVSALVEKGHPRFYVSFIVREV